MGSENKSSMSNVGVWAMNVVSSVGIIMANKQVMSDGGYKFRFATSLTGFHFLLTALVGFISRTLGYSTPNKHVPFWDLFWFSIVANVSIVGMNSSLMLNSVGFYQISKLSMIPVVCVMEWILHNKKFSTEVKATVFLVVIGVGVCTVTDVKVNMNGFLAAAIGVFCASLQQICCQEGSHFGYANLSSVIPLKKEKGIYKCLDMQTSPQFIGSLQQKYTIGSFDLLGKTAPIQSASLLLLGPFIDYCLTGSNLLDYKFSLGAIFFILLSCALAVFCNLSQYLCIGRFSAVSYQVLGHMKTVCVLVLGWVLFDSVLTLKNIMGMALAVVGMILYNWAVNNAKQDSSKILPTSHIKDIADEKAKLLKAGFEMQSAKGVEFDGEEE